MVFYLKRGQQLVVIGKSDWFYLNSYTEQGVARPIHDEDEYCTSLSRVTNSTRKGNVAGEGVVALTEKRWLTQYNAPPVIDELENNT